VPLPNERRALVREHLADIQAEIGVVRSVGHRVDEHVQTVLIRRAEIQIAPAVAAIPERAWTYWSSLVPLVAVVGDRVGGVQQHRLAAMTLVTPMSQSRTMPPPVCGEAELVPPMLAKPPLGVQDMLFRPGAVISGFLRPASVGPTLLLVSMRSSARGMVSRSSMLAEAIRLYAGAGCVIVGELAL